MTKSEKLFVSKMMNPETGDWHPIESVIKLHPYTGPHGCMNRAQPVNALAVTRCRNNAEDLVLGMANTAVRDGPAAGRSLYYMVSLFFQTSTKHKWKHTHCKQ